MLVSSPTRLTILRQPEKLLKLPSNPWRVLAGHEFGKGLKGVARFLEILENRNWCGLRYKIIDVDKRRMEKRKRKIGGWLILRIENQGLREFPFMTCIRAFQSGGLEYTNQVAMTKKDQN
ncbi:hypothetical protein CR513_34064, partial [Mucuna pruriens]